MGQAISEVLPFAIGVAIVPIPVIAVILMLFSARARVNGPAFLVGWVVGLTVAFIAVYAIADAAGAGTEEHAWRGAPDTPRWLVFDAETVAHVDATGVEALRELVLELRRDGVELVVARMRPQARDLLDAGEVVDVIGADRFFPTVRTAVAWCVEHDSAEAPEAPS